MKFHCAELSLRQPLGLIDSSAHTVNPPGSKRTGTQSLVLQTFPEPARWEEVRLRMLGVLAFNLRSTLASSGTRLLLSSANFSIYKMGRAARDGEHGRALEETGSGFGSYN